MVVACPSCASLISMLCKVLQTTMHIRKVPLACLGIFSGSYDMQLRGKQSIEQRLLARAGVSQKRAPLQNTSPADALLLVSGSHALRPLLSWTGALQVREGIDL